MSETVDPGHLFRPQAISAASERLAKPMNLAPPATWAVTGLFFAVCLTLATFLALGAYTRKETVAGTLSLTTGTPYVVSTRSGIVESISVQDGTIVNKGDVLFVVSAEETSAQGGEVGAEVERYRSVQSESRVYERDLQLTRIDWQISDARARTEVLTQQVISREESVELQRERLAFAEKTLADTESLLRAKVISEHDYRKYSIAVLDAKQSLGSAQRELDETRIALNSAVSEQHSLQQELRSVRAQRDTLVAEIREKELELQQNRNFAVAAAASGKLTATAVKIGDPIIAGSPIAVLVPDGAKLVAQLGVPSRAIGFVRVGDDVNVMFDAFPYERFGFGRGTVLSVSAAPMAPPSGATMTATAEPVYRVIVELNDYAVSAYGQRWPLVPGMGVTADLLLEKRTFMQWILDPIRAAAIRT